MNASSSIAPDHNARGAGSRPVSDHALQAIINAPTEIVWNLLSDIERWPGLMPNVLALAISRQGDRHAIATIQERRCYIPFITRCGILADEQRQLLIRRYLGGPLGGTMIAWRLEDDGPQRALLCCELMYPDHLARMYGRVVVKPFVVEMLEMLKILSEAEILAHRLR